MDKEQNQKMNQFSFSIGPSFAIGDFSDNSSGGAGTGINYSFSFQNLFSEQYGIGLKFLNNSNSFDSEEVTRQLNSSTSYTWSTDKCSWSGYGVLDGLIEQKQVSKKFSLNFKVLIGYLQMNSPEVKSYLTTSSNNWIKIGSASTGAFAYNIGAGFGILINPKWNLLFNCDYFKSDLKYDNIVTTSCDGTSNNTNNVQQPYSIINITLGIGFNFK